MDSAFCAFADLQGTVGPVMASAPPGSVRPIWLAPGTHANGKGKRAPPFRAHTTSENLDVVPHALQFSTHYGKMAERSKAPG